MKAKTIDNNLRRIHHGFAIAGVLIFVFGFITSSYVHMKIAFVPLFAALLLSGYMIVFGVDLIYDKFET